MLQKACAARLSGIKQPYPNGQVPQTCSDWVGSFILVRVGRLELPASCSQMCVGTFSRHFSALFGPFLCLGSSSLTLFCPACFKKPFRLLGFVWDWILCIKRCSARFEGGNGRPDHLSGETQELRRIKQRNTPRHDMACSEAGKCVFGPTTRS